MADGTLLPDTVRCEGDPFMPGWHRVANLDSSQIDSALDRAGWSFFYLAGAIEKLAFGADTERAAGRAVRRIIAHLRAKRFNCLEITEVRTKRFLGFPYVNVSAHARHIQASLFLFEEPDLAEAGASD